MSVASRNFLGFVTAAGLLTSRHVIERSSTVPLAAPASRIAFASNRDGNWEIYVTDTDGAHQTRLTRLESQDRFPLWSPDRSQLAFGSQTAGDHWELWVMNADGTRQRSLVTGIVPKGHREWSHDGSRIAFAAAVEGDTEIFSVHVPSGRLTRLTRSPGVEADPSWSSDDRSIAFSSARGGDSAIYVMRSDGTQPRRLVASAMTDVRPSWSPDGSRIAFISGKDGERDVHVARVTDGHSERLTTGVHATNDGARWSPDGAYIAVQTTERDDYDIQVVRMADRKRWTVAGSPAYDGQFSWSPTSDHLAFISGRDGFDAVYVTDLTGKSSRLTTSSSLNAEWSP